MAKREVFRIVATDDPDVGDMEGVHVEASVPVEGVVNVSHVAQIVGEALSSIMRQEQWPLAAKMASDLGISEDEWDQFLNDSNRLMLSELHQFVETVGRLATVPNAIFAEDEDPATEFRVFAEWLHAESVKRSLQEDEGE